MAINIRLIEGARFYESSAVQLPRSLDSHGRNSYFAWSHFASITVLVSILLLRICGNKVYYLPDGIVEYSNMKRAASRFGRLCVFLSDGILCGDAISKSTTERMGVLAVRCDRWGENKGVDIGSRSSPDSVIVATARTPYFSPEERVNLVSAIISVINGFVHTNRVGGLSTLRAINLSSSEEILTELRKRTGFKLSNSTIDAYLASNARPWIVSTISTVLLKSLSSGLRTSVLPFRGHEDALDVPLFPEILDRKLVLFSQSENSNRATYHDAAVSAWFFKKETLFRKLLKRLVSLIRTR